METAPRARIAVMVCLIGGLLTAAGCAHDRPWCLERSHVTRAQAHATVRAEGSRGREATYYVFNFDDLPASDLGQMSYRGTAAGYHLFKIFTKCTTNDALVYDIALPERQCEVAHARPVGEETTIANGNYRSPVRSDGRCTVDERRR